MSPSCLVKNMGWIVLLPLSGVTLEGWGCHEESSLRTPDEEVQCTLEENELSCQGGNGFNLGFSTFQACMK